MLVHRADDGGQQARRTGENAKQPLKPLRGECRCVPAEPVATAACFFCCRRAMGAVSTRHSPCSLSGSAYVSADLGRRTRRENAAWRARAGRPAPFKTRIHVQNGILWCARRDSNPHPVTDCHLKAARLPIPPRALVSIGPGAWPGRINGAGCNKSKMGGQGLARGGVKVWFGRLSACLGGRNRPSGRRAAVAAFA